VTAAVGDVKREGVPIPGVQALNNEFSIAWPVRMLERGLVKMWMPEVGAELLTVTLHNDLVAVEKKALHRSHVGFDQSGLSDHKLEQA
jgi:hypothetical protein